MSFPLFRFKYFPDAGYVEQFIAKGSLQFSYPFTDFNDPFDCLPHVYMQGFDKFCREAKRRYGLKESKKVLRSRFKESRNLIVKGEFYKLASRFGVCCLTRNAHNILMWSHYAHNHKGILAVFRFDGFMDIGGEAVFPMEVKYSEDRPSINIWERNAEDVEKWNLTKACLWGYEQEERMFLLNNSPGIYTFDRKAHLEALVIGARAEKSFIDKVDGAVQRSRYELGIKLPVYNAKMSSTKYLIEIPGFKYKAEMAPPSGSASRSLNRLTPK